jgi:hypothetical protein
MDEDEDIEEDGGREMGDPEDQELYCYCRKLSYGEVNLVCALVRGYHDLDSFVLHRWLDATIPSVHINGST